MSPAKTSIEKKNIANWWPNRADMGENLIPRRQLRSKRDQYWRKLAIYTKNTLFLMSPAKTSIEKKNIANWWPNRADMGENLIPRRQLRSKRDQYWRKLAIYTKNTLFLMSPAKTSIEKKNIANWWPNRTDMVENLIPRRQLRSKRDQYWRKLAIYTKNTLFLMSPAKTSIEKKNVANWWPNRADMGENLIPRRQLRSKRDQYRRKLAIYTKNTLFLMSPAKTSIKKNIVNWWPNRADMEENLISRPQLRSRRDQWRKLAIFTKKKQFSISPAKPSLEKTKVSSWWPNRADMVENLIPRRQLRSKRDQYRR